MNDRQQSGCTCGLCPWCSSGEVGAYVIYVPAFSYTLERKSAPLHSWLPVINRQERVYPRTNVPAFNIHWKERVYPHIKVFLHYWKGVP